MSEDMRANVIPGGSDMESLAEKLRAVASGLTSPEEELLGQLLDRATGGDDTSGYGSFAPNIFSSSAIIVFDGSPVAHVAACDGSVTPTPVLIPRVLGAGAFRA